MMKIKKLSFLIMTIVLLTVFATACGGSANEDDEQEKENNSSENENEDVDVNTTGFPIVDEPIELTFLTGKWEQNADPFEETLVWSTYEEETNVKVNFDLIPFGSLTERRNLIMASGDYPDALYSSRIGAADIADYGSQGVLIPLNDLIDEYAPNFKKLLDEIPDLRKGLTMPDGNIYSFPTFYDPEFLPMLIGKPLWIKETWLDQLDMDEPQTTDEFYEYLKAVKETDLNGNGEADEVPFLSPGIGPVLDQFIGAWGFGTRGLGHRYVDVDPETDELRFFRTDPKYKEVLEYVNKLYSEELIDPRTFTTNDTELNAIGAEGNLGATFVPNPVTVLGQEDYIGLGALEGPRGDQLYTQIKTPLVWPGSFTITDKNEHPEATVRWMDHFFGDEGATFYFMGVEDVSYEKDDNGNLQFIDEITNHPDGLTMDQALTDYVTWMGGSYPGYVQEEYFAGSETLPNSIEAGEKAAEHVIEEVWNNFNYTKEEAQFRQSKGSEIETYITEMEAQFITGRKPFSEWDAYVQEMEEMGIQDYLDVQSDAYERYKDS